MKERDESRMKTTTQRDKKIASKDLFPFVEAVHQNTGAEHA